MSSANALNLNNVRFFVVWEWVKSLHWLVQWAKYSYVDGMFHSVQACTLSEERFALLQCASKISLYSPSIPGSVYVFTDHSLERSLSYSPNCPIFGSISMQQNIYLAKPNGLANQMLCYIQICKSWEKKYKERSGEWLMNMGPDLQNFTVLISN